MNEEILYASSVQSRFGIFGYEELPPQCWDFSPLVLAIASEIRQEITPISTCVDDEVLQTVVVAGLLSEMSTDPSICHFVREVMHILPIASQKLMLENVPSIMDSACSFWGECSLILVSTKTASSVHGFASFQEAHTFMWENRFSSRVVNRDEAGPGLLHFCVHELKEFAIRQTRGSE